MTFPHGVVPTITAVHPTPLYEALAAVVIATILWSLRSRLAAPAVFGGYLVLSGISRFLVEFLRVNAPSPLGLTQPQLWSLAGIAIGLDFIARTIRQTDHGPSTLDAPHTAETVTERAPA